MEFKCFPLSSYNRKSTLSPKEKAALSIWYERWLIPSSKKEDLEEPLKRISEPVMDALKHANYNCDERRLRRYLSLVLVAVHRRQRVFWNWTAEEWIDVMKNILVEERIVSHPTLTRRPILLCACLLSGPEILLHIPKISQIQDLAIIILGRDAIQESITTMQNEGIRLGISPKTIKKSLSAYLCEALLLCGSALLTDLTTDVFEKLRIKHRNSGPNMRRAYQPVTRILYNLGNIPYPIVRKPSSFAIQYGVDDDLDTEWLQLIDRWFATATTSRHTRVGMRTLISKACRWFMANYPGNFSPSKWDRNVSIAYVAAVCEMNVGEWTHPKSLKKDSPSKPLKPLSKSAALAAIRVFFSDCQKWDWLPRHFDPRSSLELPRSVARLIGPDPRDIANDYWAKIMSAGLSLTKEDISVIGTNPFNGQPMNITTHLYPFEMIKALSIIWLFAGLRVNEILRLQLGCARMQDNILNQQNSSKPICMLDIPAGKTATAFSKPVDPIIYEAINNWIAIRPKVAKQIDNKTGSLVDFLFVWRGKRVSKDYVNDAIIPLLCQKSGIPEYDARGRISSHRARATIASQLYNSPNGMNTEDLGRWLGHSNLESTRNYIRPYATKVSKAYSDSEYFANNVRMIDVLVDREAVQSGAANTGQPWMLYDLGHGLCGNPVFETCAHRMACARCDFYTPKESSYAQMLEAKESIIRMKHTLTLQSEEAAAIEGDEEHLDKLLTRLEHVPTPQGPTPHELSKAGPISLITN